MKQENKMIKNLKTIFDVMFIMILCFATLLATMLLQGGLLVGGEGINYEFGFWSFLLTMGSLLIYIIYILKNSNKELKTIIDRIYKENEGA